jgi:hypothetical protein
MFADELKSYMKRRNISVSFASRELEISEYKIRNFLNPDIPDPEKWIRIGFIAALNTIGLPEVK